MLSTSAVEIDQEDTFKRDEGPSARSDGDTLDAESSDGTNLEVSELPNHNDQIEVLADTSDLINELEHDDQIYLVPGEDQDQDQERSKLQKLPLEIWLMIKKNLTGLEIETSTRCCQKFWYSRSAYDKSARYLHYDKDARKTLAALLKKDREQQIANAAEEEKDERARATADHLICGYCSVLHPRLLFTPEEQIKPALKRVCIGSSGTFRFCEHVNIDFENMRRLDLAGATKREIQACKECTPESRNATATIVDSTRTVMRYTCEGDHKPKRTMFVHVLSIPLAPRGHGGFGAKLRRKLTEILAETSWPLCSHYRASDVIGLLDDRHFEGTLRFVLPTGCPTGGCATEFAVNRNAEDLLELEVKRCIGSGKDPTGVEWLSAIGHMTADPRPVPPTVDTPSYATDPTETRKDATDSEKLNASAHTTENSQLLSSGIDTPSCPTDPNDDEDSSDESVYYDCVEHCDDECDEDTGHSLLA